MLIICSYIQNCFIRIFPHSLEQIAHQTIAVYPEKRTSYETVLLLTLKVLVATIDALGHFETG